MDELIGRIASSAGISDDLAKTAVSIILNFLNRDGPADKVPQLIAALPGAQALLDSYGEGGSSGLLGGLSDMMGGGGAMSAFSELTNAGLGMGEVQTVTQEVVGFAREKAGAELVDEVISSIPGLGQFV
ncbi:MAG: DUF2267 domain-containing protein [Stappiaceae bacterium]